MCKVAFNHFFFFSEKQCAANVLDCFRVPPTHRALWKRRYSTASWRASTKKDSPEFTPFHCNALPGLPPSLELCDFGELSATPPSTNSLSHSLSHPSWLWLLLWHFGLSLCFTVASLTFPNFVCNSFVVATPLLLSLLLLL